MELGRAQSRCEVTGLPSLCLSFLLCVNTEVASLKTGVMRYAGLDTKCTEGLVTRGDWIIRVLDFPVDDDEGIRKRVTGACLRRPCLESLLLGC